MKKKLVILLLVLTCLASLAGCTGQDRAEKTETEPDTGFRTLTRTIDEKQTVVYRFHAKRTMLHPSLYFAVFDSDVEDFRQAGNWCTMNVGFKSSSNYTAFSSGHAAGLSEEARWRPASKSDTWTMLMPYEKMDDVKEADLELTITRSGDMLKATLAVDGAKVWRAQETIKGLGSETVYLYVYSDHYDLMNVEFQDMGETGWVIPGWTKVLLTIAAILAGFVINLIGMKLEEHVMDVIDPWLSVLFTSLLFLGGGGLVLLIAGRFDSNVLGLLTFGYSPFPMPSGGPAFWIPTVICAVICVASLAFLINEEVVPPIKCVLCGPLAGACHVLLLYVSAGMLLSLLEQLFQLILGIICLVVVGIFFAGLASGPAPGQVEVKTTTRTYDGYGNLVDFKVDYDYEDAPDKNKKK